MKRKILKCLLFVVAVTTLCLGLTACGEENGETAKSVKFTDKEITLQIGDIAEIEYTLSELDEKDNVWESSDGKVATVESGRVTAIGIGSAEITLKNGEYSDKCTVRVTNTEVCPEIQVASEEVAIEIGKTFDLNPIVKFKNQTVTPEIKYTVSGEGIATVNNGVITAVKSGSAQILLETEFNGRKTVKAVELTVYKHGYSWEVSDNTIKIYTFATDGFIDRKELSVALYDGTTNIIGDCEVSYLGYDTEIISVENISDKNYIVAKKTGNTEVTVKAVKDGEDYTTKIAVTVALTDIYKNTDFAVNEVSVVEGVTEMALPTGITASELKSVTVDGNELEITGKDTANNKVTVNVGETLGEKISFNGEKVAYTFNFLRVTYAFTNEDAENFKSIIESNLAGTYILLEDMDFTGVSFTSIGGLNDASDTVKAFTGTLDGKGHSITNLTVTARTVKDQYGVYKVGSGNIIASNQGTVTNLHVSFTAPAIKNYIGFIGDNDGKVNNVLVDITLTANMTDGTSQANGSVVSRNNSNGTVKNCIAIIGFSNLTGNQKFGLIAGMNYSGNSHPISNNYAVSNGLTVAYGTGGQDVLYGLSYLEESRKSEDCAVFTNIPTLANTVVFNEDDGWNALWSVEEDTLKFNSVIYTEKYLGKFEYSIVDDSSKAGFTKDFSEVISGDIISATLNGKSAEIFSGKTVAVSYEALKAMPVGVFVVELKTATATYKIEIDRLTATVVLMQKDAENLQAIIENDLTGEYVLGEDIDMTGITFKSIGGVDSGSDIKQFTGSLDGKGFAIKNLTITARGAKDQYGVLGMGASNFIANNGGTVKNIAFVNLTMANCANFVGVIGTNSGVINNVYADITLSGNMTSSAQVNGGIVARLDAGGTVKNCIVNIHASGLTGNQVFGTVVGMNYSGAEYPIVNCYAITNGMAISYGTLAGGGRDVLYGLSYDSNTRRPKDCANYETADALLTAVTSLPTASGWANYWKIESGKLYFGSTLIGEKAE